MPKSFIIWAATRTSSTNLAEATGAENEPYQAGPPESRLHWIYQQWQRDGLPANLLDVCAEKQSFKHLPEWFDDGFNIALARLTTAFGYRHVRLIRLTELDRLISNDVAGQLNAWSPGDAVERFAEVKRGARQLNPLDVPRLIENARRIREAWHAVEPHLAPILTLIHEHITAHRVDLRVTALRRLAGFLGLPAESLTDLNLSMQRGGQNTAQIRDMIPNVGELRQAMMTEGLV
jgi:hypothetical protein